MIKVISTVIRRTLQITTKGLRDV